MTPNRSHSDTVGRVANRVRVEGGEAPSTLTSTFRNIALLTHFLRQRFFFVCVSKFWNHERRKRRDGGHSSAELSVECPGGVSHLRILYNAGYNNRPVTWVVKCIINCYKFDRRSAGAVARRDWTAALLSLSVLRWLHTGNYGKRQL